MTPHQQVGLLAALIVLFIGALWWYALSRQRSEREELSASRKPPEPQP